MMPDPTEAKVRHTWGRIAAARAPMKWHRAAARAVIGDACDNPTAAEDLSRAVWKAAPALRRAVLADPPPAAADGGRMHWAAERAAGYFAGLGDDGAHVAADVREKGAERWARWGAAACQGDPEAIREVWAPFRPDREGGCGMLRNLARILWPGMRERARVPQPIVTRRARARLALRAIGPPVTVQKSREHPGQLALFPMHERSEIVPLWNDLLQKATAGPDASPPLFASPEAVARLLQEIPRAIASMTAALVLRDVWGRIADQHEQRRADSFAGESPDEVVYPGGFAGLERALGVKVDADELRRVLNCGACLDVGRVFGGEGRGLWSWALPRPGGPLVIHGGPFLSPRWPGGMRDEGRPVWLPRVRPPLVGDRRTWAAQLNLHWAFFYHLALDPARVGDDGAFLFPFERRREVADLARMPLKLAVRAFEAYEAPPERPLAGPVVVGLGRRCYRLAPAYREIEAGLLTARGRVIAGRRRAETKRRRLATRIAGHGEGGGVGPLRGGCRPLAKGV